MCSYPNIINVTIYHDKKILKKHDKKALEEETSSNFFSRSRKEDLAWMNFSFQLS